MKRYAFAGASNRALSMYARPIAERYAATARIVGFHDVNATRAAYVSAQCGAAPVFTDFDAMIEVTRPDCVIVTTIDRYHHEYIIRALAAGCDVITEKPMTIDDAKCRAILAAEASSGRKVTVTFNYRFTPYITRVKELLRDGAVGTPLHVDLEWFLDTRHGADYFRRWHRRKENSGGLLVHKATHHFDMVNWWIEDEPHTVFAQGDRRVYGPTRVERGERCSTCRYQPSCEFAVDYQAHPLYRHLYFAAEHEDGYHRDGCVFSDEIDIEDTMSVTVRYASGTILTYSLVAYTPYEGWRASISGSSGRLEIQEYHSGHAASEPSNRIRLFTRDGAVVDHQVDRALGDHGGGDAQLQLRLFGGQDLPDPLGSMAGSWQGAMSVLVGIAANRSIASGAPVAVPDLLKRSALPWSSGLPRRRGHGW